MKHNQLENKETQISQMQTSLNKQQQLAVPYKKF
ncbi:DUF536 domain-containing protein [Leuconostoc suionicum]